MCVSQCSDGSRDEQRTDHLIEPGYETEENLSTRDIGQRIQDDFENVVAFCKVTSVAIAGNEIEFSQSYCSPWCAFHEDVLIKRKEVMRTTEKLGFGC